MNALRLGFRRKIEYPKGGFLLIDDEMPEFPKRQDHLRQPRVVVFDAKKHRINPLEEIDYKKARELASVLYALYPQGENTLTVRNGRRELLTALMASKRLDKLESESEEVLGMVSDILASPVLKKVLSATTNITLDSKRVVVARLNRKELGEFDALVLGLVFLNQWQGQVVVPDFGFYGRDEHISLIREERLIAGVDCLDDLPQKLRRAVITMRDKEGSGCLYEDAEVLARYAGLVPGTDGFSSSVKFAMT